MTPEQLAERAADLLKELTRAKLQRRGLLAWRSVVTATAEIADPKAVKRCPPACRKYVDLCRGMEVRPQRAGLSAAASDMLGLTRGERVLLAHVLERQFPKCYSVMRGVWEALAADA